MIIKKINSSLESFADIPFDKGLNIIVGAKSKNTSTTTVVNAVGKSLIGRLLNFCFLADDSMLCEAFDNSDYAKTDFSVTIEDNNIDKTYLRLATLQKKSKKKEDSLFKLNGDIISSSEYEKSLQKLFDITDVGFRSVVHYFIRNQKQFNEYIIPSQNSVADNKAISYLLNLDILMIETKIKLVKSFNNKENEITALKPFSQNNAKTALKILNTTDEIKRLQGQLDNYEIAEAYNHLVTELKSKETKHKEIINTIYTTKYSIEQATKYLVDLSEDFLNSDDIAKLYHHAEFIFPENIIKSITEAELFHKQLYQNRKKRLEDNITELKQNQVSLDNQRKELGFNINSLSQQISKSGTLEEYSVINNNLNIKKQGLYDLNYNTNKIVELEKEKEIIEQQLQVYQQTLIQYNTNYIHGLSETYNDFFRGKFTKINQDIEDGIFKISIEEKLKNQRSYIFNIQTSEDAAESIKASAIFVFDWLLLLIGNHKIDFLYHDNTVYHGDSSTCVEMLKLAEQWCENNNKQYICCIDQEKIDNILEHTPDFQEFLDKYTKVILTHDENLLGIQIPISDKK